MAKLPALIAALKTQDDRDLATLTLIGRNVREAGLIVTTGRGNAAATRTARDAAFLLLGASSPHTPGTAALVAQQYSTFEKAPSKRADTSVFAALDQAQSAADTIAVLVEDAGKYHDYYKMFVQLQFSGKSVPESLIWLKMPSLDVTFHGGAIVITAGLPGREREWTLRPNAELLMQGFYTALGSSADRKVTVRIGLRTLLALHKAVFPSKSGDL